LTADALGEEFEFRVSPEPGSLEKEKVRLDSFLSGQMPEVSRAKLQAGIKEGLVTVNAKVQTKVSHPIKRGDLICCQLPPPVQLDATPEDIPLDIVHEDEHILVVNKAAGMVVHPSPGHYTGTLVNALLHHCRLPAMHVALGSPSQLSLQAPGDGEEVPEEEEGIVLAPASLSGQSMPTIRPGIVHRLDKGTTGLMVIAKDDFTHAGLCEQFKEHSVERTYQSISIGVPKKASGVIETNIDRDPRDRLKMTVCGFHCNRGKHAVSTYQVLEEVADGRAALVQWQLETGRTHQIRVHAKHAGHAIFGDDTYSGGVSSAVAFIGTKNTLRRQMVQKLVKTLGRPALHAKTLGFVHPVTQETLRFDSELPADLLHALDQLRK